MKKIILLGGVFFFLIGLAADCLKKNENPTEKGNLKNDQIAAASIIQVYDSLYSSIKSSLEKEDYLQALTEIGSLRDAVWEETPFSLVNTLLVKTASNTFGVYEPEEDDVYSEGETIYLYLEPVGYKILKNDTGLYEFRFLADFQLVSENGEILGGQERFADLLFKSWHPNKEVAITFNYNFSGIPAGKYKIITTVYDASSDKKASAETWITVE
ncbi:MAG: hypothetical protein WBI18_01840 [Candidatus Saccharicenans sp.]